LKVFTDTAKGPNQCIRENELRIPTTFFLSVVGILRLSPRLLALNSYSVAKHSKITIRARATRLLYILICIYIQYI